MSKMAIQVQQAFEERFGFAPEHVIRAPGRVNLIGEHTDYSGGFVLPVALEHAVWIALRPRPDQRVVLHSLDFAETAELDLSEPQKQEKGWQEYLKGIAKVLQEAGWKLTGWEGVIWEIFHRELDFPLPQHLRWPVSELLQKLPENRGSP